MTDQQNLDTDFISNKKRKLDIKCNIHAFDCKQHFGILDNYIKELYCNMDKMEHILTLKTKKNLPDTNEHIVNAKKNIQNVRHNIYYNTYNIRNIISELNKIDKNLKHLDEKLCDHDKYSESQYHNERYYYCRKCTWTN